MDYLALKHAHAGFAYLSALLFVVRFALVWLRSSFAGNKLVKILPHVVDTLLLVMAIMLCVSIGQYPLLNGWLTAKLLALVLLIGAGVVAIKKRQPVLALVTLALYVYMIGVAKTHSVLSWLS
ncbi:SirB2 family protein [Parathalassolituus penaei]|uniref:SirB2 family protein n=1 Tax=Parathalassolituus penaei TaxID=2997323 RepID=A0A9X3EAZ6_9GAMM|nr:SirB2 family protein [Parathalassolituus penaei]MCY0964214.1 SirB2 family protein [Parathalassolituus penaei]